MVDEGVTMEWAAESRLRASGLPGRRILASAVSRLGRTGTPSEGASQIGLDDRLLLPLALRLCRRLEGRVSVGEESGEPGADGRGEAIVGVLIPDDLEARAPATLT